MCNQFSCKCTVQLIKNKMPCIKLRSLYLQEILILQKNLAKKWCKICEFLASKYNCYKNYKTKILARNLARSCMSCNLFCVSCKKFLTGNCVSKIQGCSASTCSCSYGYYRVVHTVCVLEPGRKIFKLFLNAEQLCVFLYSKYMWIVVVCRKIRGVQRPQLYSYGYYHVVHTLLIVYWSKAEKFLKLFLNAEQLCAFLYSKYMWIVVVIRKFRRVQHPQL